MEEEVIEIGSPFAAKRVILLHGLTGTATVIRPVAEYLYRRLGESYSFILPTAQIIKVKQFVHAWFDVKSSDFRREVDVGGIFASSDRIASLIRKEISQGVSPKDIYLGGFSQGGVIALTTALLEPFAVGGVFALSSYLPLEDQLTSQMTDASKDVPIFQAVSLKDEFISQEMSYKASEYLRKRGNAVLVKRYDMKHEIRNRELDDIINWMESLAC
ncbi:carboxylesterase [Parasutterella sp.]|uniref:alpha/beta hydrolase n=1 Tax=Parasutterella sp. TaxID=2049037 RepID=UPI00307C3896